MTYGDYIRVFMFPVRFRPENRKPISFIDGKTFRCPNPFGCDSSKPHVLLDRKG